MSNEFKKLIGPAEAMTQAAQAPAAPFDESLVVNVDVGAFALELMRQQNERQREMDLSLLQQQLLAIR